MVLDTDRQWSEKIMSEKGKEKAAGGYHKRGGRTGTGIAGHG